MIYLVGNGPMQTTAPFAKVGTGTTTKSMLQLKLLVPGRIIAWGVGFDGFTAATPIQVELITTSSVFATVTATAAADITPVDGEAQLFGSPTSNYISVGTSATGYTASAEGSITATTNIDFAELLPPTGPFLEQFPLGQEGLIAAGVSARIRMTAPAGVNAYCFLKIAF
jgi:hypothetical protein